MNGIRLISGSSFAHGAEVHGHTRRRLLCGGAGCGAQTAQTPAPGSAGRHPRGHGSSARRSAQDGDNQTKGGVVQGNGDAVRQLRGLRCPWHRFRPFASKISIMPMTVPSKPSKGAAEAMVPSALRYFSAGGLRGAVAFHGGRAGRPRCTGGCCCNHAQPVASTSPSQSFGPAGSPRRAWAANATKR